MTGNTAHSVTGGAYERVRFFPRQLLGADDFNQDSRYWNQRLRNHNRFLHGWGVVSGCEVRPTQNPKLPWQVRVCPGYVLSPQGDEIHISAEVLFDVATCLSESADPCAFSRPCPPITRRALKSRVLYLAVRYLECPTRPVRVAPVGCGCDEAECDYSRLRDGYEFACLSELPTSHKPVPRDCTELCTPTGVEPYPTEITDPWVVLATLTLPASDTTQIKLTEVDPLAGRKPLYSTERQQQLGTCMCGRTAP